MTELKINICNLKKGGFNLEELIDVLDENGTKTGKIVTRKQVHEQGLWHRIIVVAIIDKDGHLLMQQRSKNKAKNPLKWDVSSAGHVSSGQTSTESAIRETQEELGIDINEEELQYILTYKDNSKIEEDYIDNQIYDCYIVKKDNIDIKDIKMQESEVEQVKLCNLKEFNAIIRNGNVMERDELYNIIIEYLK